MNRRIKRMINKIVSFLRAQIAFIGKVFFSAPVRAWIVARLSMKVTWVQIFTLAATVTGVHLTQKNEDLISTIGVTICAILSVYYAAPGVTLAPIPPPEGEPRPPIASEDD